MRFSVSERVIRNVILIALNNISYFDTTFWINILINILTQHGLIKMLFQVLIKVLFQDVDPKITGLLIQNTTNVDQDVDPNVDRDSVIRTSMASSSAFRNKVLRMMLIFSTS